MPTEKIQELIPNVSDVDVLDDNDDAKDSIELDNEKGHAARMLSLHQLARFANLHLRRSKVRSRLDKNDADTIVL